MLNKNDRKEIAGKLKALFPKASDSGREQLLNLLINCCCIDLCSINNNADDIQFTGLTLSGNTLSLTLTINGTPTTQVVNLPTQISTTLVNNGDGTFTYTNESNVVTTIDVATLLVDAGISDGFVNNNDGTLTHAAIDGTVVRFDINDLLLTTTPLFTVNVGTTSVSTDASLGSQVITYGDILHFWSNGSLNFNVQAGSVVVGIDTEADIIPYTPTTLVSTNVGDALDELAANSHNPTTLTNTAAPFSWNVSTQAGNIPLTPTLTDNGDGTITYNPNNGAAPITIDTRENSTEVVTTAPITINGTLYSIGTSVQTVLTALTAASHLATTVDVTSNPALTVNLATQAIKLDLDVNGSYNNSGTTLVATSVQDAITELAATSHPLAILTNNAAPFSWNTTTQAGNIPVSPTLVNNGNGTITFTSGTGTAPVTIDVTENASEVLTTTPITINGTTYPANTAVETILSAISTYAGTTNLTYTPSATNGTIVSDTGTDAVIPSVTLTDAGLATPAMLTNSHVPVSSINSSITIVQSGVNSQTLKADITGIATATSGQVASTDGAGNIVWTTPSSGVTDLTYTPSATNGIVVSSTGTDATISAVDNTNAGLATPAMLLNSHVPATFNDSGTIDFTVSGTDNQTVTATLLGVSGATIGQVPQSDGAGNITWVTPTSATNLTYTASPTQGTVLSDTGTDAIIPSVTVTDAGLATPSLLANSHVPVTTTAGTVTITQSGTDNQTLKADITGISGATTGQVPSKDALGDITWITPAANADNGLHVTGGITKLGGQLIEDTVIVGELDKSITIAIADAALTEINKLQITNAGVNLKSEGAAETSEIILNDGELSLRGETILKVITNGTPTSPNGSVLTLIDNLTGEAEWQPAGGSSVTVTDSNTIDLTVTGSDITGSVKLDTANGGLTATTNGLLFNADGVNTYDNTTSGITATTVQDAIDEVAGSFWRLTGNAGTDGGTTNFVGTTDAQDLVLKTNNVEIARFGQQGNTTIGSDLTSIDALYISPLSSNPGDMAFQSGQATGIMSTAFGASSATAPGSMAWGVGYKNGISPIASGVSSTAWGDETSAVGRFSTCFGFQNIANAEQSTCFGQENTNNANYATVFGFQNTAEGYLSTIFGSANISDINGANSTIWGTGNQVSNAHGTAWGQDNVASGISSTVFGKSNRSEALYSLASGFNNVASGDNSVVFGAYNNSVSYAEMVLGHFSTFYIPISITTINTADRLLTVGNGTNALTTNNALTLWKDGRSMWNGDVAKQNTWIGVNGTNPQNFINVTTPTGSLAAISTEHTTSGNYAVLGSNAGNSGLVINNTKQFSFTTTAGTTSTALGATTTVGNYSSTGFLFGGGGVATSTVDVSGSFATNILSDNTAALTLTNIHRTIINTGAATTYTLPVASTCRGREYVIANHGTGTITFATAVRVANGVTITTLSNVAGTNNITIQSDGTTWVKTSN